MGRRSVIGLRIVHPISREEILRVPFQLVVSRVRTKFRVAFHTPHTICNVTGFSPNHLRCRNAQVVRFVNMRRRKLSLRLVSIIRDAQKDTLYEDFAL